MKGIAIKKMSNKLDLFTIICLGLGGLFLVLNMILISLQMIKSNTIYWLIVIFPYFLAFILVIITLIYDII